jgi:tRNA A37 threonylcarbamoyladenosine dehydratase
MLKNRRVAVFGLGGVGGQAAESLCRAGVGALDVFDGDVVCVTNINRQVIATQSTIGKAKTQVMAERLIEINPGLKVTSERIFYLPENADDIDFSVYDYIIDAVDTVAAKLEIICRADSLGVPVISSMGAANKLDPTALEVSDIYATTICPLARVMRRELRRRGVKALKVVYSKEKPLTPQKSEEYESIFQSVKDAGSTRRQLPASNSFVPPVAGIILASEVVGDLLKRFGQTHATGLSHSAVKGIL